MFSAPMPCQFGALSVSQHNDLLPPPALGEGSHFRFPTLGIAVRLHATRRATLSWVGSSSSFTRESRQRPYSLRLPGFFVSLFAGPLASSFHASLSPGFLSIRSSNCSPRGFTGGAFFVRRGLLPDFPSDLPSFISRNPAAVDIPQGTNFCRSESEDEVPRRNPTAMGSSSSPSPMYHNVAPRGSEMKRCAHCGGKFGLVRYKWVGNSAVNAAAKLTSTNSLRTATGSGAGSALLPARDSLSLSSHRLCDLDPRHSIGRVPL
jgi:hypothetical protein